jgi:hypothetical protein
MPAPGTLDGQSADFSFRILDARGYGGEIVATQVLFNNTGDCEVEGWQLGIVYDPRCVELADTACGDVEATASCGGPADFCAIVRRPADNGLALGFVVDYTAGCTLPPGVDYHVLTLYFRILDEWNCACTESPVGFADFLEVPSIHNSVVCRNEACRLFDENLTGASIHCRPLPACCAPACPPFPADGGLHYLAATSPGFRFTLDGLGTYHASTPGLQGTALILRSRRRLDEIDCPYIVTELTELALEGTVAGSGWRVVVTDNSKRRSSGVTRPWRSSQPDDFPARGELQLYFKILVYTEPHSDDPDLVLFNREPAILRNAICSWPPLGHLYPYEPAEPAALYEAGDPDGPPVGRALAALNFEFTKPPPPLFLRGDCNTDGTLDIADAIELLGYLFLGCHRCPACLAACDMNGDACEPGTRPELALGIADPIYLLSYLFLGGPGPPAPFPYCGTNPCSRDEPGRLGCEEYPEPACRLRAPELPELPPGGQGGG